MKLLIENWRAFLKESENLDQSRKKVFDFAANNQNTRISFARKIAKIIFTYKGKDFDFNSVSLEDRINIAAKPSQRLDIGMAHPLETPSEQEIQLFRQEAELLFKAMDQDIRGRKQTIQNVSKNFDKYIDFFIEFTSNSEDKSYEGRLEYAQDKIDNLRSLIGYDTPEGFPSNSDQISALLATSDNITPEQERIRAIAMNPALALNTEQYADQEIQFIKKLKVKATGKAVNHPLTVGSVKRRNADKISKKNENFGKLIQDIVGEFPPKNGKLKRGDVVKYNKEIDRIANEMENPTSSPELQLKPTHDQAMQELGLLAPYFFNQEDVPVTDYIKDKYQVAQLHYFNPNILKNEEFYSHQAANIFQNKIDKLKMELSTENDPKEIRRLNGNIEKATLDRNIELKKARMAVDKMRRYKAGFENRVAGKSAAIPLPEPHGRKQYTGYAEYSGYRNLMFGGMMANIYAETGTLDRTLDSPNQVKDIMKLYLKAVGGPLPNPIEKDIEMLEKNGNNVISPSTRYSTYIFNNYVAGADIGEDEVQRPEMPAVDTIESLDDLDMEELDSYMNLIDLSKAPVQGTGDDGDIDLDHPENIEWMVGEINKIMQSEGS